MKKLIFTLIGICLIALVYSCHRMSTPGQGELDAPIDSLFSIYFSDDSNPGAIVLVARGDSVIYSRGFGMARLDVNTEITDSTLFNVCSISKQFGAMAILKLQEQGLISLDDSVNRYFPEFKSPIFGRVTLRHLLAHTSGIPDKRPRTDAEWAEYVRHTPSVYTNVHDYKVFSLTKESIRYMENLDTLDFEPGTRYEYENPTYQLIMPLVERVTGQPFDTWMEANIFAPAGLTETVYFSPSRPLYNFAHGYRCDTTDGQWREYDYGEAEFFPTKADGGLYSSARDFLKWENALMSGRVVSQKSLKEATHKVIRTERPHTFYGLGLYIEESPGKPRKIYHTGDNGGFLTFEGYFPHNQIFYLIFANRPDWPREKVVAQLDSILLAKK